MSGEILTTALLGQQQHEPPAGAHFILLGGAAAAALVLVGVRWRRGRHDRATADEQSTSHDRRAESTHEKEER